MNGINWDLKLFVAVDMTGNYDTIMSGYNLIVLDDFTYLSKANIIK